MVVAILLTTLCNAGRAVGDKPAEESSTPEQIARLIRGLDDESFRTREAAQGKLLAIGQPALPKGNGRHDARPVAVA